MKKIQFTLDIEFSEDIKTEKEIIEIINNLDTALWSQANSAGLAPETSEAYTKDILVTTDFKP